MVLSPTHASASHTAELNVGANVSLSMLEYYLFTFVRFPLAMPNQSAQQAHESQQGGRSSKRQGEAVTGQKSHQPQQHAQNFSNFSGASGIYQTKSTSLPYGEALYLHIFKGYLRHYLPHQNARRPFLGFTDLERDSELFLRIVIEFWLEGSNVATTTAMATQRVQHQRLRHQQQPGMDSVWDLDVSYDAAQSGWGSQYDSPPTQVQRGIRHLVSHLVSDPGIAQAVTGGRFGRSASSSRHRSTLASSEPSVSTAAAQAGRVSPSGTTGGAHSWPLSPAITASQQPFYNYIRSAFRSGAVHISNSVFFTALKAWLVWLEPWNVVLRNCMPTASNFSATQAKDFLINTVSAGVTGQGRGESQSVVIVPKVTSRSKYTKEWEPYIAANLHLYTVPLAIFLRRARELDFSSREFRRSLRVVQCVFRVFSPLVMDAINRLLGGLAEPSSLHPLSGLVARHEQLLGEFCPPKQQGRLNVSSCATDVHNLLEEMYLQHKKTVRELDFFDRIASKLESLGGYGEKGDEVALGKLVAQARSIVGFPPDYEVLPREMKHGMVGVDGTTVAVSVTQPERVNGLFLTEKGREQIMSGTVQCSALDVPYLGDPMTARARSFEIPFLVRWTVAASNWLNRKLGLVQFPETEEVGTAAMGNNTSALLLQLVKEGEESRNSWIRINLRFLADYRNILFFAFVGMIWKAF